MTQMQEGQRRGRRRCTGCRHKDRAALDASIVAEDTTFKEIGAKYGLSTTAVFRHQKHVAAAIVRAAERKDERLGATLEEKVRALEAAEAVSTDGLIRQMTDLQRRTLKLLDDAEAGEDGRLRAVAVAQVRENVLAVGKFLAGLGGGDGEKELKIRVEHISVPLPAQSADELVPYPSSRDDVPGAPLGPRRIGAREWEL